MKFKIFSVFIGLLVSGADGAQQKTATTMQLIATTAIVSSDDQKTAASMAFTQRQQEDDRQAEAEIEEVEDQIRDVLIDNTNLMLKTFASLEKLKKPTNDELDVRRDAFVEATLAMTNAVQSELQRGISLLSINSSSVDQKCLRVKELLKEWSDCLERRIQSFQLNESDNDYESQLDLMAQHQEELEDVGEFRPAVANNMSDQLSMAAQQMQSQRKQIQSLSQQISRAEQKLSRKVATKENIKSRVKRQRQQQSVQQSSSNLNTAVIGTTSQPVAVAMNAATIDSSIIVTQQQTVSTASQQNNNNQLANPSAALAKTSGISTGKVLLATGAVIGGLAAYKNKDKLKEIAKPVVQKVVTAAQEQCIIL